MKTLRLLLFMAVSLTGFISCEKNVIEETDSPNVERYIELLKSNSFDSLYLPSFSYKDIPALLEYRNDTQIITNFPHNPISSLYNPECTLGMYVLWTIESIRADAIDSKYLIMGFPSQNPILALRNSTELHMVFDPGVQEVVANAYNNWWEINKRRGVNRLMGIDPLSSTDYRWH